MNGIVILVAVLSALGAGVVFYFVGRAGRAPAPPESEVQRKEILDAAKAEGAALRKQAELDAAEIERKAEEDNEKRLRERKAKLKRQMAEARAREEAAEKREQELERDARDIVAKQKALEEREKAAETVARNAASLTEKARKQLEDVAGMSADQARVALEAHERAAARKAAAAEIKRIEDDAEAQAKEKSNMIIGAAIQRYASEYVTERTVATVSLPSDDVKGRIIGREGRNIRALEAATGIDLIIDDTPEAVVISCFNPVRREVARVALTRLIADGRIHPSRIEEMVQKAESEVVQQCRDAAEQAIFDLGLGKLHPELAKLVGELKLRSSAAQNLLQHSIEVGYLAGAMAGELGLSTKDARRAGLLHDIGKAVDQEVEGAHAHVGAQIAKKHGEPAHICHAIAAHHGEVETKDVLAHLVEAANLLSGHRPGARREMLDSYVQRLGDLENIAGKFEGVHKAFAIQAGREVRVMVENAQVDDEQARALCRDIAREVEGQLTFPGHVKVAVVRETRATEYAS